MMKEVPPEVEDRESLPAEETERPSRSGERLTTREHITPSEVRRGEQTDRGAIHRIRERIQKKVQERPEDPAVRQTRVADYQQRHIPEYLQQPSVTTVGIQRAMSLALKAKEALGYSVKGEENIPPKGPFIVASNHSGGETNVLLGLFAKFNTHIAAGEELNWKRSGFRRWLLQKMGMISVPESLSNLNAEEKDALLERVPGGVRKEGYKRVMEHDKAPSMNPRQLQQAVALLSRGDVVATFPEGLFTYEKERKLRKAYGGIELLALEYLRITGQELTILPVAVDKGGVSIGVAIKVSDNQTQLSDTDWIMRQIALMLPEDQQGYYKGVDTGAEHAG